MSQRLDLAEILVPAPTAKKARLFSTASLNTHWIHRLNGDINLTIGEAGNHSIRMNDMHAELVLNDGTLEQGVTGRMGRGELSVHFTVDAGARPVSAEFEMKGRDLDTVGLVALRKDNFIDNGTFDADIDLSTHGLSMADFAANADGGIRLNLNGARMKNQSLDFIGGDIFSNLVTIIDPLRSIGEYIDIECSVMALEVKKGMATSKNGMAMKTDRVTLLAGGSIDLGDESLKILIFPKARTGLGINPSSLVKIVSLGGTLSEPKIEADSGGLLGTGAAVGAALYSGGLSLLVQGLLDRNRANADVCGLAATGGARVKVVDVAVPDTDQ